MKRCLSGCLAVCLSLLCLASVAHADDEWKAILQHNVLSEYSKTRQDAIRQVDTNSVAGLKAIWSILDKMGAKDPLRFDWFVREGAYEAIANASSEEALAEIASTIEGRGHDAAKEAIIYSIIWSIRREYERENGGNEERKVEHYKELLRRARGVDYYALVLPITKKHDPKRRWIDLIHKAFEDRSPRVRLAALQGMTAYPDTASVRLLIANLEALEKTKSKNYKEWVFTRFALETLTGQYYRDDVKSWLKWWELAEEEFSIEERVAKEASKDGERKGKTRVVSSGGVTVAVNMKIAGEGYPLLVLPQRGYEPDYFRPYFHGIEEFCTTYYVEMPRIQDFQGLARLAESNFVIYPTETLANALGEIMKEVDVEKFAVFAHGPGASTLAYYLAAKLGDRVTHLILVNPSSAGAEYRKALDSVEREGRRLGNNEVLNGAKRLTVDSKGKPSYEPQDDAEAAGLARAIGNLEYGDPSSPEIGTRRYLYPIAGDPQVMNDSSWKLTSILGSPPRSLQVCVMHGMSDPWSPSGDVLRVAKHFDAYVAKFPKSAQNPFMFETYQFTREIERFLAAAVKAYKKK